MERLSLLDSEFLVAEDAESPLHIAGISVFEGPVPATDEILGLFASKLDRIPRYRQLVHGLPLDLGRPVWVDDPHFDVAYHVRRAAVPAPGGYVELCTLLGHILALRLDRGRPLWESWIVEGLEDGRWALVSKAHHCMADGITGVDFLSCLLETDPDASVQPPSPWTPAPIPSEAEMIKDALGGLASDATRWAKRLVELARRPEEASATVATTRGGVRTFIRNLEGEDSFSVVGSVGRHRRYAHGVVQLDEIAKVREALGGTINDVVLAAIAGGYRALFERRGELDSELEHDHDHDEQRSLRALVPVSVRNGDESGGTNRVSATVCELPVHLATPRERLEAVCGTMATQKKSHMVDSAHWVTEIADLAPPILAFAVTRLAVRAMHRTPQRSVHTIATNVPGPVVPLYCLGRRMTDLFPYVPITQGFRTGIAIVSYDGRAFFGITADYDTMPDVDLLASAIGTEFTQLGVAAGAM